MKRLKILFKYKIYFLFIFAIITALLEVKLSFIHSKYSISKTEITGTIIEIKEKEGNFSLLVKAKEKIIVKTYNDTNHYQIGDIIKVNGIMTIPPKNNFFNLFNYKDYLLSKKIFYIFKASNITITDKNRNIIYIIKRNLIKYINTFPKNTYLKNFIFGDNDITDELKESYQINGISHLFSISGMNITFFATVITFLIKKIIKNKKCLFTIISTILLIYILLTNMSPSVIRGALFFFILSANKLKNQKAKAFEILLISFSLMIIYNPYYIYNNGFLFSYIISGYLIIFGDITNKYKNYFFKLFIISLISFLASIPILINTSFEINLLGPIINVIFVPYVSLIIFPLSLIVLFLPFLNFIFTFLINLLETMSLFISKINFFNIYLSHINIIIISLYYILITYILFEIKKNKWHKIIIIIIVIIIHHNINILNNVPVLYMLDVGQGDSLLIVLPNNKGNILIDTGGLPEYSKSAYSIVKSNTIPFLKSIGVNKLDYLILTHGDGDHMKEANTLYSNFKISNILTNSGNNNELEKEFIKDKNVLQISEYKLHISGYTLNFINKKNTENENEDSLVIYTIINNYKILLTGDAGIETENYIMNYDISNVNILKVGHHGSKNSSSDKFITKTNPELALISVGENNRFGHPNSNVIKKLENIKSKIFLTSISGTVKIILNNKLTIKTSK